jgi:hypothetical protein
VLVKPIDGLKKGALLGPLLFLLAQVCADGEAVRSAREQVDLEGHLDLGENFLRLVALLDGEDLVHLGGSDGQWACDGRELLLLDKGRVRREADVDTVLVVSDNVLYPQSATLSQRPLHEQSIVLRPLTLAPKQYPTAPIFFAPCWRSVSIPLTMIGSMAAGV